MLASLTSLAVTAALQASPAPAAAGACEAALVAYSRWAEGWKFAAIVDAGPARRTWPDEAQMRLGWSDVAPSAAAVRAFKAAPTASILVCPAVEAAARKDRRAILTAAEAAAPENRPESGVNRLSLPVLSPDGREAIVEIVHTGQRHGGLQQFVLLRKTAKGWRIVSHRGGAIG